MDKLVHRIGKRRRPLLDRASSVMPVDPSDCPAAILAGREPARQALDLQNHRLLDHLNRAIRKAESEVALLEEACQLCIDFGKFDLAWIEWVPGAEPASRAHFAAGPLLEIASDPSMSGEASPTTKALREGRIVVCQNGDADPSLESWRRRIEPYGIRSSAALPLSNAHKTLAILNLHSQQPGFFTHDRLELIEELSQALSFALRIQGQKHQWEETERAFAAQEMEYRATFEQRAMGMVQISTTGHLVRVNHHAIKLLGYSQEDVIGHHFYEFTHPEDRQPALGLFQSLVNGHQDSFRLQKRFLHKDGRILWAEVSGGPVRNPQGEITYLLATLEDITERKANEIKLLEEKAKLQTLIQTLPDLVWLKDLNGAYQFFNRRFEAFIGLPASEFQGKTDYDLFEKDLADWFREHDRMAIEADGPSINEEWVTFALDGHRELLETIKTPLKDGSGRSIGVLGIARDVTGNRMNQERLRKLSKAIEHSPVIVMITDIRGIIEYVNPRFTELTGYTEEEALGKTPSILKSSTTPPEVHQELWQTILKGCVWHGELQNRKKGGELYWEVTSISPILDESGAITHFVALKEDITDLKRVQTELQDQLNELHRWNEATLGREVRVLELKREVNALLARLGEAPRYRSVADGDAAPSNETPS